MTLLNTPEQWARQVVANLHRRRQADAMPRATDIEIHRYCMAQLEAMPDGFREQMFAAVPQRHINAAKSSLRELGYVAKTGTVDWQAPVIRDELDRACIGGYMYMLYQEVARQDPPVSAHSPEEQAEARKRLESHIQCLRTELVATKQDEGGTDAIQAAFLARIQQRAKFIAQKQAAVPAEEREPGMGSILGMVLTGPLLEGEDLARCVPAAYIERAMASRLNSDSTEGGPEDYDLFKQVTLRMGAFWYLLEAAPR